MVIAPSDNNYRYIFAFESAVSDTKVFKSASGGCSSDLNLVISYEEIADEFGYILHMHRDEYYNHLAMGVH
jgi:hypothetical protein